MPDMQEQINKILSNPEALRQVQSLGEQLGLNVNPAPQPPKPAPPAPAAPSQGSDLARVMGTLAPIMSSASPDSETAALLNALRPFLSAEKAHRLDQAQRIMKLIKLIPLIKDSGLFL